jgi:hypothetical protein
VVSKLRQLPLQFVPATGPGFTALPDALLRLPEDGQELLVVDNCPSTDATCNLVAAYEGIRYVREDRPGLNVARNRALREAVNEIVAFTDDDTARTLGGYAVSSATSTIRELCVSRV